MSSRLGIFNDRNYALYALGNTISSLGMWAQRVGVGWLSWELSHSASWVGMVSLCQFLPLIFCAPLFGGMLDRWAAGVAAEVDQRIVPRSRARSVGNV